MAEENGFIEAVKRRDSSAVADLLHRRPELVGFAGDSSKTGLHWAAETDQLEVARVLLDAGADLETNTSWCATPLDWAATMGSNCRCSRGGCGVNPRNPT